jgi:hypothetical protein
VKRNEEIRVSGTDPATGDWSGRDTMLTAIAQVGQAIVQLHGPLPEDVAEALRALMTAIQRHD